MNTTAELQRLIAGNTRFASGQLTHPHLEISRRLDTARNGQDPFALVIGCLDSRVPVETIFDQGIGDLVVIRNAGPTVGEAVTGTIEFALFKFNIPLIIVMGHTECGTVRAALLDRHFENTRMESILNRVRPIAQDLRRVHPEMADDKLMLEIAKANASTGAQNLIRNSSDIKERIVAGTLRLETALYHLDSGKVEWLGFQLDKPHR